MGNSVVVRGPIRENMRPPRDEVALRIDVREDTPHDAIWLDIVQVDVGWLVYIEIHAHRLAHRVGRFVGPDVDRERSRNQCGDYP